MFSEVVTKKGNVGVYSVCGFPFIVYICQRASFLLYHYTHHAQTATCHTSNKPCLFLSNQGISPTNEHKHVLIRGRVLGVAGKAIAACSHHSPRGTLVDASACRFHSRLLSAIRRCRKGSWHLRVSKFRFHSHLAQPASSAEQDAMVSFIARSVTAETRPFAKGRMCFIGFRTCP